MLFPWEIDALLAWILENSSECSPFNQIDDKAWINIVSLVTQIVEIASVSQVKSGKNPTTFEIMFRLAHQQFEYQNQPSESYISRQRLLFEDFDDLIVEKIGVPIDSCLQIIFLIWAFLCGHQMKHNGVVSITNLEEAVCKMIKSNFVIHTQFTQFMHSVSCDINEAKQYYLSENTHAFPWNIFYPTIPSSLKYLNRFLMFKLDSLTFLTPSPFIIEKHLKFFVYNYLSTLPEKDEFKRVFGEKFQSSIEIGLNEARIPFVNERQLKKLYSRHFPDIRGIPTPDAVIMIGNITIVCEIKTRDVESRVILSPDENTFQKNVYEVREGLFKSLKTINLFDKNPCLGYCSSKYFIFIITYLESHLGYYGFFGNDILQSEIDSLNLPPCFEPHNNIFILSVTDFDLLIWACKNPEFNFEEFLNNLSARQTDPKTSILHLRQVFKKEYNRFLRKEYYPEYLSEAYSKTLSIIENLKPV